MDALFNTSATIHFYDTDRHVIVCGVPGFADRSTKHARSVTCRSCMTVLAERRAGRDRVLEVAPAADGAGLA